MYMVNHDLIVFIYWSWVVDSVA